MPAPQGPPGPPALAGGVTPAQSADPVLDAGQRWRCARFVDAIDAQGHQTLSLCSPTPSQPSVSSLRSPRAPVFTPAFGRRKHTESGNLALLMGRGKSPSASYGRGAVPRAAAGQPGGVLPPWARHVLICAQLHPARPPSLPPHREDRRLLYTGMVTGTVRFAPAVQHAPQRPSFRERAEPTRGSRGGPPATRGRDTWHSSRAQSSSTPVHVSQHLPPLAPRVRSKTSFRLPDGRWFGLVCRDEWKERVDGRCERDAVEQRATWTRPSHVA